jgi:hypothetical protein
MALKIRRDPTDTPSARSLRGRCGTMDSEEVRTNRNPLALFVGTRRYGCGAGPQITSSSLCAEDMRQGVSDTTPKSAASGILPSALRAAHGVRQYPCPCLASTIIVGSHQARLPTENRIGWPAESPSTSGPDQDPSCLSRTMADKSGGAAPIFFGSLELAEKEKLASAPPVRCVVGARLFVT